MKPGKKILLLLAAFFFYGTALAGTIALKHDEAMLMAISNSLDIQITEHDLSIKRYALPKEKSIFDTFLNAGIDYDKNKKEPASSFAGSRALANTRYLGLDKKIPSGTELGASLNDTRSSSDSLYSQVNPYHEVTGIFSLKQPLGKNFFGLSDRAKIKITKLDIENSELTTLDELEHILYMVDTAYWSLALKQEELAIRQDMLKEARRLYQIYKQRYELGTVEKSECLAMEANVRMRESEALATVLAYREAQNELLFLLNNDDSSASITAIDKLAMPSGQPSIQEEVAGAVSQRRDYNRLLKEIEIQKIDLVAKKNSLWPEIDLSATYERNGLDRKINDSFSGLTSRDNPEIYLGLKIKLPLENNFSRSALEESKLKKAKLLLSLKRLERFILKEITNRVMEVNNITDRLNLAGQTVNIQKQKLQEELESLSHGRSSSDLIVRYENDFLDARLYRAYLLFSYRNAQAKLALAKNSLLDKYWGKQ